MVFALSWDMPLARFGGGSSLPRRYTRFFGREGRAAPALARYALEEYPRWERLIDLWQGKVLRNTLLPAFYRYTLFNELYFVTDGGTLWLDSSDGQANPLPDWEGQSEGRGSGAKVQALPSAECRRRRRERLRPRGGGGPRGGVKDGVEGGGAQEETQGERGQDNRQHNGHEEGEEEDSTCHGSSLCMGQFLYLEGHEYLMYNTLDVHFYASFALAQCWPMLQLGLMRDVAKAVGRGDSVMRTLLGEGDFRPRKVVGAVPHDMGTPSECPFFKLNAYVFQDVSQWKDLGPKFVLQVYRDFVASGSWPFLLELWPTVVGVMRSTEAYDTDGDGLIENSGFPDQTYDIWSVKGPSAYTGGLWVAALSACAKMAELVEERGAVGDFPAVGDTAAADDTAAVDVAAVVGKAAAVDELVEAGEPGKEGKPVAAEAPTATTAAAVSPSTADGSVELGSSAYYQRLYLRAKAAYKEKLWNGRYLNYDGSGSAQSDSIMADMLAGQWYARATGLPPVVEGPLARSCLDMVFQNNVLRFGEGRSRGAVNGMSPGGEVDSSCLQSREVWTGVTYAVGAAMLHEAGQALSRFPEGGLPEGVEGSLMPQEEDGDEAVKRRAAGRRLYLAAFETVRGLHDYGWWEYGYWFQMPEGWERSGNYRSLGYMRSLAVWAVQWAIEREGALSGASADGGGEGEVGGPTPREK